MFCCLTPVPGQINIQDKNAMNPALHKNDLLSRISVVLVHKVVVCNKVNRLTRTYYFESGAIIPYSQSLVEKKKRT